MVLSGLVQLYEQDLNIFTYSLDLGTYCCENGVALARSDVCNHDNNCGDGSDEGRVAQCDGR